MDNISGRGLTRSHCCREVSNSSFQVMWNFSYTKHWYSLCVQYSSRLAYLGNFCFSLYSIIKRWRYFRLDEVSCITYYVLCENEGESTSLSRKKFRVCPYICKHVLSLVRLMYSTVTVIIIQCCTVGLQQKSSSTSCDVFNYVFDLLVKFKISTKIVSTIKFIYCCAY